RRIAQATPGFSGADLANTMNEAALLAARRKGSKITQADLDEAIEKGVAGPERKSRLLNDKEQRRVAYHEVGHALVAAYSEGADPVHKISIVPRERAALGYTMQLPMEEQFLATRGELFDKIRGLLGGRAAEDIVFHEVSTGAENDLERATGIARQMVCLYGMNEVIGLSHVGQRQTAYLANPDGQFQTDSSDATAREIDEEVKKILDRLYGETTRLLSEHRASLDRIAEELLKRETISGDEFYQMLGMKRPQRETTKDIGPIATPNGKLVDQTVS
ncbi:MAG: cell division protein FtsH, partial [Verrucomicrobiota bacterium]